MNMCINAETLNFHHEDDCTYTLLHILKQVKATPRQLIFKMGMEKNVSFVLKPSTSIIFSGQCITHRQSVILLKRNDSNIFITFASYGNAGIYRHIKKTFDRVT